MYFTLDDYSLISVNDINLKTLCSTIKLIKKCHVATAKYFIWQKALKFTWRVISIILTDKVAEKDSVYRDCRGDSSNCSVLDYLRHCQLVCYHGN